MQTITNQINANTDLHLLNIHWIKNDVTDSYF